jgi:hypothetical protein
VFGRFSWTQRIDYWRIPFRCFGCHEVGHLMAHCRMPSSQFSPFKKSWKRKANAEDFYDEKVEKVNKELYNCPSVNREDNPGVSFFGDSPTMISSKSTCHVSNALSLSNDNLVATMEETCKPLDSKVGGNFCFFPS